jgi:hypothetical protein
MPNLTIAGQVFEVADDPKITVGTPLTEGMASSLQQTRRENIRNNFASKVRDATNDGEDELSQDDYNQLQTSLNGYAEAYEFGVRATGVRRVTDPVEKEARDEVRRTIQQRHFALHGKRVTGEPLTEAVDAVMMGPHADEFRQIARDRLAERDARGAMISENGLPSQSDAAN